MFGFGVKVIFVNVSVLETPTVPSPDAVYIFANSEIKVSVEL